MLRTAIYLLSSFLWISRISGQANNCECVAYYLCKNGTIITNGESIIDIRLQDDDDCPNYLDVCCKKEELLPDTEIRAINYTQTKKGCGYRNEDGIGFRIAGALDNEAEFGEFPWMVAIMLKGENDIKHDYKCGGSLIHPQVVLTAAHCISGGSRFLVRAGEWDTRNKQERLKHQERKVISGTIHREYKKGNLQNDIALLFLESPFDTSLEHINVACLPQGGNVILSDECFVTGWGKDNFEAEGVYQNILKKIEVPIVGRRQCENAFRKTRLGRIFKLHSSIICAGGRQGKDACTGDGGGPLVCPIPGKPKRYQQAGIVSWGIGCGTAGVPGAYADVAHFRDWIDQKMSNKGYSTTGYTF